MPTASSKKSVTALKQAIKKFKILENEISVASKNISYEIASELQQEIVNNYQSFVASLGDDPQYRGNSLVYIESDNENRYRVVAEGDQIIYDEFGTGENGEMFPHPEKNRYKLEPYNSGPTIRTDKFGNHYWVYNGKVTYGVPAGMFIYNSLMNVTEVEARKIAQENISKAIDKSMKG